MYLTARNMLRCACNELENGCFPHLTCIGYLPIVTDYEVVRGFKGRFCKTEKSKLENASNVYGKDRMREEF